MPFYTFLKYSNLKSSNSHIVLTYIYISKDAANSFKISCSFDENTYSFLSLFVYIDIVKKISLF